MWSRGYYRPGLLQDCRLILRHNDGGGGILVMIKFNESPDNLGELLCYIPCS